MTKVNLILLLILISLFNSCSEIAIHKKSQIVEPRSELGISANDIALQVEQAKKIGGAAAEFLATDLFIKGNDASIRGDYQTAGQIFRYCTELAPNDVYIKRKLAIEFIRLGELKEAETILQSVFLATGQKDESTGLILAGVYTALEKMTLARETYQKIIDSSETDSEEACLFLAKSFTQEKKYTEAHNLLVRCEKKNKDEPVYSFYRGKIEQERGHLKLADKFFKKSLKIDHTYAQAALAIGAAFEEQDETEAAAKIYKEFLALEGNSNSLPVLSKLVTLLFTMERNKEILPYAELLTSIDTNDLNLKVRLGLLYSENNRYEEALNLFKGVLAVVPESDKVLYYLGALSLQTQKVVDAIEYYQKIPASSPLYGDASLQMAQVFAMFAKEDIQAQKTEAVTRFHSFIDQRSKENEEIAFDLKMLQANFYEDTFQIKKSIETIGQFQHHKNFSESHSYYFASLLEKDGQFVEARKLVQKILDKEPNNPHALNFMGYSYLEKNENMGKAFEFISRAVKLKPKDGYIRDSLAWYYFQVGKFPEALAEAKKAFELVRNDVTITKHLGIIYQRLHNFDKAREYLAEALSQAKVLTDREDLLKIMADLEKNRLPASLSH
jgi:tetratricopeptide (TPR) repeat protein